MHDRVPEHRRRRERANLQTIRQRRIQMGMKPRKRVGGLLGNRIEVLNILIDRNRLDFHCVIELVLNRRVEQIIANILR